MSKQRYTLDDIRRRKAEVALKIELERVRMQSAVHQLTNPPALLTVATPWRKVRTAFKIAKGAFRAYRTASSVVSLFRKRR